MKYAIYFALTWLLVACGTTKKVVPQKNVVSMRYIQLFHEANRFKLTGQLDRAISAYDSCLIIDPNSDAAAYGLSQCYLNKNNLSKASEYTLLASKLDPSNIWYTQELAYMYHNQQKYNNAEVQFAKLVKKEPENIDWQFAYADVLKKLGKVNDAIFSLNAIEGQLGVIPDLSIRKFELYQTIKQDEKGLQEIQKARDLYPDDLSLIGTLIDYYFSKNKIAEAQKMLTELVVIDPSNQRANLALGDLYYRQLNKPKAYEYFKQAYAGTDVDIDTKMSIIIDLLQKQVNPDQELLEMADLMIQYYPNNAKAYSIKGDLLLQKNDKEGALKLYKNALGMEDQKFPIWNQVLLLEYDLQKFDDLYTDARACSALFPSVASVQLFYTIASVQLKRFKEALDAAEIGKSLVVNDPITLSEFYAQSGDAQFALKNNVEGKKAYEEAIKLTPNNNLIKNNYAMRLAIANTDLDVANKLIDEVLSKTSIQAPFIDTKGFVLFQKGEYQNALKQFTIASELDKNNSSYLDHMGDALVKLGDINLAVECWKKAQTMGAKNKSLTKKIQTKTYVAPEY